MARLVVGIRIHPNVEPYSSARSPTAEKCCEIRAVNYAVAVHVSASPKTPRAKQDR